MSAMMFIRALQTKRTLLTAFDQTIFSSVWSWYWI